MTRDEIIRIALYAGWNGVYSKPLMSIRMQEEDFLRFAAIVATAERQACLVMVKDILAGYRADIIWQDWFDHNLQHPIQAITAAFKERGEE
jgi:hypothetical protein